MNRPEKIEYNPYFQSYIDLVELGDFQEIFTKNTKQTIDFFNSIPLEKHNYKYGIDKWTIKEVLMHIIDTERVFAYRTLVCLRGDNKTSLQMKNKEHQTFVPLYNSRRISKVNNCAICIFFSSYF